MRRYNCAWVCLDEFHKFPDKNTFRLLLLLKIPFDSILVNGFAQQTKWEFFQILKELRAGNGYLASQLVDNRDFIENYFQGMGTLSEIR